MAAATFEQHFRRKFLMVDTFSKASGGWEEI
jgi:hypothetical protein